MVGKYLISVVDDDRSMGKMLARGIEAAGFEVAVFCSAEEFFVSERIDDSDCLILDIDMAGMSGIELQQRLIESGYSIPIIFISGHADLNTRNRALAAGAVGFFNKPFDIDSLLSVIQSLGSFHLECGNLLPLSK